MSTDDIILVLNSGSSSLKLAVFSAAAGKDEPLYVGSADALGRPGGSLSLKGPQANVLIQEDHTLETQTQALDRLVQVLLEHLPRRPVAVGHRVVHGGPHLREHTRITPDVLNTLAASIHFAPLHIPAALESIRQAQQLFPNATHIACFDTAFHRTMPPKATRLAIPERYAQQGVQRYGFHGLSCESVVHRLETDLPARLVIAHLGSGCSVTAVQGGKSIDTSMGMSPTGGLPMATRTGDLDPGVLLYMLRSGLDVDSLEQLVNHDCGLTGISGGESDMRELQRKADANDQASSLAIDIFCDAIAMTVAGYITALRGLDLLVFTGGIGEHSQPIRSGVLDRLQIFGMTGDQQVKVLPAEEESQMARHCRALL